jgi:superfamily II DNA helicase RecQ
VFQHKIPGKSVPLGYLSHKEAHLLNTWGRSWRKAFRQIGFVRARFSRVVLIALTATMRTGQPMESVCESLGLHRGQFHFIRRSNARPDVQILFRTMMSGMGGKKFPELGWVLRGKRKTLIFCRTIHLGYCVKRCLFKIPATSGTVVVPMSTHSAFLCVVLRETTV